MFRNLDAKEADEFRQYARDNYDDLVAQLEANPGTADVWHPVLVEELGVISNERETT